MIAGMILDKILKLHKKSKIAFAIGLFLFVPASLLICMLDGLRWICGIGKSILIRRWKKEIIASYIKNKDTKKRDDCKNLAGLGGQGFRPRFISWQTILKQSKIRLSSYAGVRGMGDIAIREVLFFGYFGPLEAWCESNCQGGYFLWSDDSGVYLILMDEMDEVTWKLTWDGSMPSFDNVNQ